MVILRDYENLKLTEKSVVAIGFFDGVHKGHRQVLQQLLEVSEKEGLTPCVFTFDLTGEESPKENFSLLCDLDEQARLLEEAGVAVLFRPKFSEISHLTPEETVVDLLAGRLAASAVVAGYDLRFGKKAAGDLAYLQEKGGEAGIRVFPVAPVMFDGQAISSTRIREAVKTGDTDAVKMMLGRPFSFSSRVCDGQKLGRTLGFPTLNQEIPSNITLPRFGVYCSLVECEGVCYQGVTNIGIRPTVGGELPLAETHLLHAAGDFYQKNSHVQLLSFLRPEQKFDSVAHLQRGIAADILAAEAYFSALEKGPKK
ncbi:MAG: riboflavin biosynthesis protein RibF [Oscillospiraceae bacterium]|nr:riboflavin biosynthesis protein RibF [Oscillospiraceae bacterium]